MRSRPGPFEMTDLSFFSEAECPGPSLAWPHVRHPLGSTARGHRGRAAAGGARPAAGDVPLQDGRARRGRAEPPDRRVHADAGRAAQAPGPGRGQPVRRQDERGAARAAVVGGRLGRRTGLGFPDCGRGLAAYALRALGRRRRPVARAGRQGAGRRRTRSARARQHRGGARQPAAARVRHDRGVRQAHRARGPDQGGGRRPDRRGPFARLEADLVTEKLVTHRKRRGR